MKNKKHSVRLREKKLANGNISLYLDIWYNGKRTYEFLKLYINKPTNSKERETNNRNKELAEGIRAKRQIELKNDEFGFSSGFKSKTNFLVYFKKLTNDRFVSKGNYGNWESAYKHLSRYAKPTDTLRNITPEFAEGFKRFLANGAKTKSEKQLSINSQHSYFNKFKAAINKAYDEGLIPSNPIRNVHAVKAEESKREYLTLEELKKLVITECRYPVLKNAFLFSCLTGLRWSDANKLQWKDVVKEDEGYRIIFRQKKTQGQEYLDIGQQAKEYMGEEGGLEERVFIGLRYSAWMNVALSKWVMKAGITKDITFHCSRHTFAVLQLNLGTDIFTVSKLLGHTHLKTTQVYAKIVDEKKKAAMNIIPNINL